MVKEAASASSVASSRPAGIEGVGANDADGVGGGVAVEVGGSSVRAGVGLTAGVGVRVLCGFWSGAASWVLSA